MIRTIITGIFGQETSPGIDLAGSVMEFIPARDPDRRQISSWRGRWVASLLTVAMLSLVFQATARAGTISPFTFNFNSLANNASNTSIQNYMNGVFSSAGTVTVSGAVASNSYNGDGHVVGPGNGTTSLTLATSDGGVAHTPIAGSPDTFIQNVNGTTTISMKFSTKVYSVSFDYEIFPDGTCPTGGNCGANWPDFTLNADGIQVFKTLAVQPSGHSPASGKNTVELAPQYLGQSGTYTFAAGVTQLTFVDWPATIGIDNLVILADPVPEPPTLVLLAMGIMGVGLVHQRGRMRRG